MGEFNPSTEPIKNNVDLKFNIKKLFGEAFPSISSQAIFKLEGAKDLGKNEVSNLLGLGYKVNQETKPNPSLDWSGVKVAPVSQSNVKSYLGTPIFQQIKLKAGTYNVINNGIVEQKNFPNDLILPATSTAEFKRNKIIGKTTINGNVGSIKEMWSFSDWEITIRGLIITEGENDGNNANIFPEKEFNQIFDFENIADSIEVTGGMFGLLKIKRIVIETPSFGKIVGMPNVIPFQFNCTSDEAADLIIAKNQLGT